MVIVAQPTVHVLALGASYSLPSSAMSNSPYAPDSAVGSLFCCRVSITALPKDPSSAFLLGRRDRRWWHHLSILRIKPHAVGPDECFYFPLRYPACLEPSRCCCFCYCCEEGQQESGCGTKMFAPW